MKTKKQIITVLAVLTLFLSTGSVYTSSVSAAAKTTTPEISQEKEAYIEKHLALSSDYANKTLTSKATSNYSDIMKYADLTLESINVIEKEADYIKTRHPNDEKALFESISYLKSTMYFEKARVQIEHTGNISQGISDLNKALEADSASVAPYLLDCTKTAISNNNKTLANIYIDAILTSPDVSESYKARAREYKSKI